MNANRKMRKLGSREETRIFSQQSVLSAMDRFVLAVENMNETVMVPSRLMDMSAIGGVPDANANAPGERGLVPRVPDAASADLHAFYTMLNAVKTELIWGNGAGVDNKAAPALVARRLSTVSSLSLSDSEPDTESCSESDSTPDSSLEFEDRSAGIARSFRHHLMGLYDALQQLTDTAEVLTCRYQDEVGGTS